MKAFLASLCITLSAQTPTFEAASVKPAAPSVRRGGSTNASGDRYSYANTTLLNALCIAYSVKRYQIDGPAWITTDRYDIIAKAPDNTPRAEIPGLLQVLLTERFQLKLHHESREMPVYLLVRGKGAPKFQKTEGELGYDTGDGHRIFKNHTMAQLADFIAFGVQRPVFDRTGLVGADTFPLEMSLEELGGVNAKPDSPAPSIYTIIEGLGLKLESHREPVEVIVIDSGNKIPIAN